MIPLALIIVTGAVIAMAQMTTPVLPELAAPVRERAERYLAALREELVTHWPTFSAPSVMAAQIEQETCISLSHRRCWSPHAELKTQHEYGFGLGQITVTRAYDNFAGATKLDSSLATWEWEDRFNPTYQLRTLVLTNRINARSLDFGETDQDQHALMLSAYNGGLGGTLTIVRCADSPPAVTRRSGSATSSCIASRAGSVWPCTVIAASLKSTASTSRESCLSDGRNTQHISVKRCRSGAREPSDPRPAEWQRQ